MNVYLLPTFLILSISLVSHAGPSIVDPGERMFADDFSGGALDAGHWSAAKGDWAVEEDAATGAERASDQHAAVMRTELPFSDAIIRFRFKLDSAQAVSLSINAAKGHHSRVNISPDGFTLIKDRDKKDPRSLQLSLGRCNIAIDPGAWHTMSVEYSGPHMMACLDGEPFVIGTLDSIAEPKANFGFTVRGGTAVFDDVEVFSVKPCADQAGKVAEYSRRQTERGDVSADPRTAYAEAEAILRLRLMADDEAFNALLNERIAIEETLHKRWPKAFRKGSAGTDAKKKLLSDDAEFKALNARLARARRAENAYLLKVDPQLAELAAKKKKS